MTRAQEATEVVSLSAPRAVDASLAGAKAASLAQAGSAGLAIVPGFVLTTRFDADRLDLVRAAWSELSDAGRLPLVVRSSSTAEDGAESSMAGLFTSVLDVWGWESFVFAVREVLASRTRTGLVDAPMAVLVQRQVEARWGGVLFGADPVSGRTDRLVVSATDGGPDRLVSGLVDGWTAVLNHRGRVLEVRHDGGPRPDPTVLGALADLARKAGNVFGGPQDVEWAVDGYGTVHLLQSRPITTLHGPVSGPVLGAGPLAETFPEPLSPLEADLWVEPVREGIREAVALTGTASPAALRRSEVVSVVNGWPVADLDLLGATSAKPSFVRKLDPRPPARRLRASWRVGRLSAALPAIARDVVGQVDGELAHVPGLDTMSNDDLLAVLDNGRRFLTALHGHEALAGLLVPAGAEAVTAASTALSALAQAQAEGVDPEDLVDQHPVVLALVPPRVGGRPELPVVLPANHGTLVVEPHPAALAREALRLRVRWVHELMARAAWELGTRLSSVGVLPSAESVRLLTTDELRTAVHTRTAPEDLAERAAAVATTIRTLPTEFRLAADGTPVATTTPSAGNGIAVGAGGGRGRGPVHLGTEPDVGAVLVVSHLDPRLAPAIPRLAGLVAETGSPLSHLAILAREYGVPIVVGLADARSRFAEGEVIEVDGTTGAVAPVAVDEAAAPSVAEAPTSGRIGGRTEKLIEIGAA